MARPRRSDKANGIYHMLNRGNWRESIFHKREDFEAFERMMVEALERSQFKLFAYCLLPYHWHIVVSPEFDSSVVGKQARIRPGLRRALLSRSERRLW